jgi:hypothetical protein
MKRTIGTALVALSVTACVSPTEIVPIGEGRYMVSATSHGTFGGAGSEGIEATKAANAYCDSLGKQMVMQKMDKHGSGLDAGVGLEITASVIFKCIGEGDPEHHAAS